MAQPSVVKTGKPPVENQAMKAYTIIPIDSFGHSIVELTIVGDRVISRVRDVESLKEIKANKLLDILMTGRPLDSLVTH